MLIDTTAYSGILAYIVSDVHLNNHLYNPNSMVKEKLSQHAFSEFLEDVNHIASSPSDTAVKKVLLILNGDILDITGSWFEPVMPWDDNRKAVEETLQCVLEQIFRNNPKTLSALQSFIEKPNTELLYVFGNHDGILESCPQSHRFIRQQISDKTDNHARIHFLPFFEFEPLELYVEHGHRFDPYNGGRHFYPVLGDVVNVLIVNRIVDLTVKRLEEHGYAKSSITKIHKQLHNIEYLRPLSLLPVWIQKIATQASAEQGTATHLKPFDKILRKVLSDTLLDSEMIALVTNRLHIPKALFGLILKLTLRVPAILPLVSFIASKITRKTHSNDTQYREALTIAQKTGLRLIAFGHTHIPGIKPLGSNAYFFNTGSWKPVINLFKAYTDDLVELEYLHPDVQFNKVERFGILKIEKLHMTEPATFSLTTLEKGHN